jgi:diguanylate cyclase (GGDEF)-like protein
MLRWGSGLIGKGRISATYLGYSVILAIGSTAIWFCIERSDYEYRTSLDNFRKESEDDAKDVSVKASQSLANVYQNIRTISLLPSVRDIDRHGTNIDEDARSSIQQIYNNLATNVAVSEVYIVPVDLEPEKIDPVTGKLEEPILMFDELILAAARKDRGDKDRKSFSHVDAAEGAEEIEIHEYRQLKQQMTWFRERYPSLDTIDGMQIPFINGEEVITCDNTEFDKSGLEADRTGLIFSVPFYGRDGRLKGAISAIIRTKALMNLLPNANFALIDVRNEYLVTPSMAGQVGASSEWVHQALPDPKLFASILIKLPVQTARGDWQLWAGFPNADFLDRSETRALLAQRDFSIGACLIIMLLTLVSWRSLVRRRLTELAQWRDLSEATLEGLLICDGNVIVTSNGRFISMIGSSDCVLAGKRLEDLITDQEALFQLGSGSKDYIETKIKTASGADIPVEILARSMTYLGKLRRVLAVRDQSDLHEAEKKIRFLALRDALTGLANRNRFIDELQTSLKRVAPWKSLAVLYLDLDSFKHVNDTLGHGIGDQLLRGVAARLEDAVREADLVARMGGDEFAIILAPPCQPEDATAVASRLIDAISDPYNIDGHQIVIGTSIGISLAPGDGTVPHQLLKNADLALYRAKAEGKQTFRLFEAEMDAKMQARRVLELELRQALALDQFDLAYQPIVDSRSRTTCGFEALLRWRHPERGLVQPLHFIALAEEIGLMGKIGAWVLKQACHDAMSWPSHIRVAVNVSPAQFRGRAIELDVLAALGTSGLPGSRLEIEITESVLMEDTEASVAMLQRLRGHGVRVAMDDFGTGYSSLSYLQKFPFDKIKIDKSFVSDSGISSNSQAIIQAILGLAATFGMSTTAEGIETENQLGDLSAWGCAEFQGYLFSKPLEAQEVASFLSRGVSERGEDREKQAV